MGLGAEVENARTTWGKKNIRERKKTIDNEAHNGY
jgi:hypothetical protein